MNYPKMLYKGEAVYTDSDQIKQDLQSRKLLTMIVPDEETEQMRRTQGWVDLFSLMAPRPTLTLPKQTTAALVVDQPAVAPVVQEAVRVKRKYTKRISDHPK